MKLPISDQFLWAVYKLFEKTGEVLEPKILFELRKGALFPMPKDDVEFLRKLERKRKRRQFAQFVNQLKKKGYIKIANLKGKKGILLTPKGKQKILKVKHRIGTKPKRRKDRKWIMVVYDIPETRRRYRDDFRNYLISFGFQEFQKSIWVCPYDVLKDLEEVIRILSLDKFIRIFLIEEIELQDKK